MVRPRGARACEHPVNNTCSPFLIQYVTAASPRCAPTADSFAQPVDDRSLRSYYGGTATGEAAADAEATPGAPPSMGASKAEAIAVYGNLEIRVDEIQALIDGRRVGLTVREFQVLSVLALREDRVMRRADIYGYVWGGEMKHRDRSVDVFVRKVRNKLARLAPDWAYIHTHFGVGYRFAATPPEQSAASLAAVPSQTVAA